jgi:glycosyltransferase involved in cell wall biosynthesis
MLLSKKGHAVELIVPNVKFSLSVSDKVSDKISTRNSSRVRRVPGFSIPTILGPIISTIPMFIEGLRRGKNADIIVCQYHPHHFVPIVGVILSKIFKRPVVVRACDVYRNMGDTGGLVDSFVKGVNGLNEFFIRFFSDFLVCCSDFKAIVLARKPQYSKKVHLLFNGFDSDDFRNMPSKLEVRKSLGIFPDGKMVVFIGRFSGGEYGTEVLLKAFSLLLQTYPQAVLFLIGDKLSSTLSRTIETLNLKENIRVFGAMPHGDVVKFIVASDVCIGPLMPTQTIPLKVIEYMACNKPIVTGKGSVSRDMKPDENLIETIPTPIEISGALLAALSIKKSQCKNCNADVFKNFSWQSLSIELDQLLVRAIKSYR